MLSILIVANKPVEDISAREREFMDLLKGHREPFEFLYLANSDYKDLYALQCATSLVPNHYLITFAPGTSIEEQIYSGLKHTDGEHVLLCEIDTKIEILSEMLEKRKDGINRVFVRKQESFFVRLFSKIGSTMYNLGLSLLGKDHDMFYDEYTMLLNGRSVDMICLNPNLSKAIRLVNATPKDPYRLISEKEIYSHPTPTQQKPYTSIMGLGIVSFVYILALLTMAIVYPLCNEGIYSWWIIVCILVWVGLGLLAVAMAAKKISYSRLGLPVRMDLDGYPAISIEDMMEFGDPVPAPENTPDAETETKKRGRKPKQTDTQSPASDANVVVADAQPQKKRGRKPAASSNAAANTQNAAASSQTSNAFPAKRGRKPNPAKTPDSSAEEVKVANADSSIPKKRGRKPGVKAKESSPTADVKKAAEDAAKSQSKSEKTSATSAVTRKNSATKGKTAAKSPAKSADEATAKTKNKK